MLEIADDVIKVQKDSKLDDVEYVEINDPYGYIYITTNLINGKRYLGQQEFSRSNWKKYLGSGTAFKKALALYGEENFSKNIIYVCYSDEELNQIEYELSVYFDVVESNDWYNLVLGGGTSRGWHPSEETKKKISEKAKIRLLDPTNHPCYGKPGLSGERNSQYGVSPKERMDEETYNQWYEKHKQYWENLVTKGVHIWEDKTHPRLGVSLTQAEKDNLSKKAKERLANPENHPMYGKEQSEEAKNKMVNAHKLRNINKGITVYSLNFNRIFYGAVEVAKEFGIDQASVTACCRGKQKYCGIDKNTGEKMVWMYSLDAIKNGYLSQEIYNLYVENIEKEIDVNGKTI